MVILEGPDGAGKTTLARQLQTRFGFELGERGTSDRSKLYTVTRRDTYTALADAVRGDEPAKLWDRLFFSEQVYAPVVGRECEFSTDEQMFIRSVMSAIDCPVIVCLPPWSTVKAEALKEEQMAGVLDNLRGIYDEYDRGPLGWPNKTLWYDWTGDRACRPDAGHDYYSFEEISTVIEEYLVGRQEREWDLA